MAQKKPLTPEENEIYGFLLEKGGAYRQEMIDAGLASKNTLKDRLNGLEAKGYLERRYEPRRGRGMGRIKFLPTEIAQDEKTEFGNFFKATELMRRSFDGELSRLLDERLSKENEMTRKAVLQIVKLGGKRMLPTMLFLSGEAVGGNPITLIRAAVALELIHISLHVRMHVASGAKHWRGVPTINAQYGTSVAISTADLLKEEAIRAISSMKNVEPWKLKEATKILSEAYANALEGEGALKENENTATEEEFIEMCENVGLPTTEAACRIGALIGGGNEKEIGALANYGRYQGCAFRLSGIVFSGKITSFDGIAVKTNEFYDLSRTQLLALKKSPARDLLLATASVYAIPRTPLI